MIRLFKHYIPHAVLLLGLLDFALLLVAADLAWHLRVSQIGASAGPLKDRALALTGIAFTTQTAMIAVGVYGTEALRSKRFACARLLVAASLAILALALIDFVLHPALRDDDRRCAAHIEPSGRGRNSWRIGLSQTCAGIGRRAARAKAQAAGDKA